MRRGSLTDPHVKRQEPATRACSAPPHLELLQAPVTAFAHGRLTHPPSHDMTTATVLHKSSHLTVCAIDESIKKHVSRSRMTKKAGSY